MKFLLLAAACLLCYCQTEPASNEANAGSTPAAATPAAPGIPPLPPARLQRLRDSVTYIDYVFYEQAFSMSMDERAGIDYSLAGVSEEAPGRLGNCPAIGRVFYKIGGRTVEEADIHFTQGCTYFAFVGADKRPAYANALSEQGKSFFNGQFKQLVPNFQPIE